MTFETLEKIRLYVGQTARASRAAAQNAQLNGYRTVALRHENEAAMGFQILNELVNEYGELHADKNAHDESR